MRRNKGTTTKKITIVVPEAVEVIDLTYYWKASNGCTLKTCTTLMEDNCADGNVIPIYKFPEEEETCTKN